MATRIPLDPLTNFVADVVTDVREKLVDEAWFGRLTAPQERVSQEVSNFLDRQQPAEPPGPAQGPTDGLRDAPIEPAPIQPAMTWEQVCAQMSTQRGPEIERPIDHEIDR